MAGWLASLVLATTLVGCSSVTTLNHDGGEVDGGVGGVDAPVGDASSIDGAPIDADAAPSLPSSQSQTSGGGAAMSASYRLQVQLGAPQPMGTAGSARYRVLLGSFKQ